jgi:hypothetical protein
MFAKNLAPTGIRSPDHLVQSQRTHKKFWYSVTTEALWPTSHAGGHYLCPCLQLHCNVVLMVIQVVEHAGESLGWVTGMSCSRHVLVLKPVSQVIRIQSQPTAYRKDHSPGLMDPEDEGTIIHWNDGNFLPSDTMSYPRFTRSWRSTIMPRCDSHMIVPYCEGSPLTAAVWCTVCVFLDRIKICCDMKSLCSNKQQGLLNCVMEIKLFLQREHPGVQYDTKSRSGKGKTGYISVTLYWGYWMVLWLFHLVCVLYCGCCFTCVICGWFVNVCTCIYCVLLMCVLVFTVFC